MFPWTRGASGQRMAGSSAGGHSFSVLFLSNSLALVGMGTETPLNVPAISTLSSEVGGRVMLGGFPLM